MVAARRIDIDEHEDILDVRDIIARVEFLESADDVDQDAGSEDQQELEQLWAVLEQCKGYGGDEQWRGDWYPITLIRDDYFTEYAQELAEDIGAISPQATWPLNCIDWERAARELQMDYSTVEYNDVTYWYR